MNHVSNGSPCNKDFIRFFITIFITFAVFTFIFFYSEAGEQTDDHENSNTTEPINEEIETSNYSIPLAGVSRKLYSTLNIIVKSDMVNVYANDLVPMGINISEVEQGLETENEIEEPEEPVRSNKLYCIIEGNYTVTLDIAYQDYLYEMCVKYGIEQHYELLLAQMYHESGYDAEVISKSNDYGLMQINKCNHDWLGELLGNNDFLDPYNNIEAGVIMMSEFLTKYNDVQKALVCYNKGENAVIKGTYSTIYSTGVLEDMKLLVEIQ